MRLSTNQHIPDCAPSTSYAATTLAPWSFDRPSVSWAKPATQPELQQQSASDLEYFRRLEELMRNSNQQLQQQQQHGILDQAWLQQEQQKQQQKQHEKRPQKARRRKLNLDEIPMLGTSPTQGACSSSSSSRTTTSSSSVRPEPTVDWRVIVEEARRQQLRISGNQMLTDTFR